MTKEDILKSFAKNVDETLRMKIERKKQELNALEEKLTALEG